MRPGLTRARLGEVVLRWQTFAARGQRRHAPGNEDGNGQVSASALIVKCFRSDDVALNPCATVERGSDPSSGSLPEFARPQPHHERMQICIAVAPKARLLRPHVMPDVKGWKRAEFLCAPVH
jgi:hypothetical protein